MSAGIVLGGEPLKRPRSHDLQAQVDDALVGREQLVVDHRHLVGEFLDLFVQAVGRDGVVDQTTLGRFGAGDAVAGQQHALGELGSAVVEPHVGRRRTHRADRREADHGVLGGDDDVGEQDQVGAASETVAVDFADDRLVHVEDRHPRALRLLHAPGVVVE